MDCVNSLKTLLTDKSSLEQKCVSIVFFIFLYIKQFGYKIMHHVSGLLTAWTQINKIIANKSFYLSQYLILDFYS